MATAERHGLDYFLTTDKGLLLETRKLAHKAPLDRMRVRVLSPTQLGEELGVITVPPILLSYGGKHAFIITGVTMPNEKRRPRKNYRQP